MIIQELPVTNVLKLNLKELPISTGSDKKIIKE